MPSPLAPARALALWRPPGLYGGEPEMSPPYLDFEDFLITTLPTAVLNETTGIYLSNENPSFARNDIKARASATGLNQMEDTYFA